MAALTQIPETLPIIRWRDLDDTLNRVYHTELPGGAEELLIEDVPTQGEQIQERVPHEPLNGVHGVWHEFRVEALDADLNESTRAAWPALLRGLPAGPSNIAISGTGGSFTLALTA